MVPLPGVDSTSMWSILQGFNKALDDGEGRAQFVTDIGDEFLAEFLVLKGLGDVVGDDDQALGLAFGGGGREGAERDIEMARGERAHGNELALGTGDDVAGGLDDLIVADNLPEVLADGLGGFETEEFSGGFVDQKNALHLVGGDDAFGHGGEDGEEFGFVLVALFEEVREGFGHGVEAGGERGDFAFFVAEGASGEFATRQGVGELGEIGDGGGMAAGEIEGDDAGGGNGEKRGGGQACVEDVFIVVELAEMNGRACWPGAGECGIRWP